MNSPHPSICLSLSSEPKSIAFLATLAQWIEVRFDLFPFHLSSFRADWYPDTQFIATCRKGILNEIERFERYRAAIQAGFQWIDLDYLQDQDMYLELKSTLKDHQTSIIWSYHNFTETPDIDQLKSIRSQLQNLSLDSQRLLNSRSGSITEKTSLQKMACLANSSEDMGRLMSLYPNPRLIAFGMGEAAVETRIECVMLGAPFTYAHPDEMPATAPGQISFSDLLRKLKDVGITKNR